MSKCDEWSDDAELQFLAGQANVNADDPVVSFVKTMKSIQVELTTVKQ
jgi:hypothetical protein